LTGKTEEIHEKNLDSRSLSPNSTCTYYYEARVLTTTQRRSAQFYLKFSYPEGSSYTDRRQLKHYLNLYIISEGGNIIDAAYVVCFCGGSGVKTFETYDW